MKHNKRTVDTCGMRGKCATKKCFHSDYHRKQKEKRSGMERMIKGLDKVSNLCDGVALFLVVVFIVVVAQVP